MTWFGSVSAWGAAVYGVLMLGLAALHFSWRIGGEIPALVAILLLAGSFRTIRAMSGGLRLLAGAWGALFGLVNTPMSAPAAEGSYAVAPGLIALPLLLSPWVALAGLALTVLHKERK